MKASPSFFEKYKDTIWGEVIVLTACITGVALVIKYGKVLYALH